ncbi:helix-turn-helix domain-containing protein [Streptomyces sp. NP160]|uniref:helix-turn-helix domain-containing protein n=1 Tax=Streptomyces sp. NP160 TaxID=2586637 RepID=UPI001C5A11E3|nr:helix-turn-helix domain-containing protein [Streptomyces sp. NP160]
MTTLTLTEEEVRTLPPVVNVPTAAAVLGISPATAYRLIRAEEWPTPVLHLGRYIRIPRAALLDMLELRP